MPITEEHAYVLATEIVENEIEPDDLAYYIYVRANKLHGELISEGRNKNKKKGGRPSAITEEHRAMIVELREEHKLSYGKIAKRMGMPRSTISHIYKETISGSDLI